jgi:hypothetical protein
MNTKTQFQFIPFHAINEFMRNDFRLNIIRTTLISKGELNRKFAAPIDRLTRKHVKVAGFRNSLKAPVTIMAVAMVKAFEKHPDLVAAIVNGWSESKTELRSQISALLTARGWKLLPIEVDRSKLPGFLTEWPEEDDYETLYEEYNKIYPENEVSIDETSLMVIWLSGRLPITKVSKSDIRLPEVPQNTESIKQERDSS